VVKINDASAFDYQHFWASSAIV